MGRLSRSPRVWVMPAASFLAVCFALSAYLRRGSGVDRTAGALLVVVALALILLAGLVNAAARPGGPLRVTLLVLTGLDVIGSLAASYLLHAWVVLGFTSFALVGWILLVLRPKTTARRREAAA